MFTLIETELELKQEPQIIDGALLKRKEVLDRLRISKSTLYAAMDRKEFPRPVRVTPRTVRWRESDIEACLQRRNGGVDPAEAD